MSADLKSLFSPTPALKSVVRPEDLGAESLARHLPWLSAPHDDVILTRQGDLMASAVVAGQDSFTCEEAELTLATASLARLIGQLGEGFGYYISKLTLPDVPALKPFEGEDFASAVDRRWQSHLTARALKRRVLLVTLILRPTVLNRMPVLGSLFRSGFVEDLGARRERLNEAMGLMAGVCQGLGFRRLTISSGEWLGLLGVVLGQPMANILPMPGQFIAQGMTSLQVVFGGKQVRLATGLGDRVGTIFSVKTYPAGPGRGCSMRWNCPSILSSPTVSPRHGTTKSRSGSSAPRGRCGLPRMPQKPCGRNSSMRRTASPRVGWFLASIICR